MEEPCSFANYIVAPQAIRDKGKDEGWLNQLKPPSDIFSVVAFLTYDDLNLLEVLVWILK